METFDAINELRSKAINENRHPVAVSMNEMVYFILLEEATLGHAFVADRVSSKSRIYDMDILIHGDEADPTIRVLWKPHRDD